MIADTMAALDNLALSHRVPSTRDGIVIKVGLKVKHLHTEKEGTVISIKDFWGNANDVGGFCIGVCFDGNNSEELCFDEFLFVDTFPVDYDRSSFCEVCDIHFDESFVEWSHSPFNETSKGRKLCRPTYSICKRCDEMV